MSEAAGEAFEQWCVIEQMGHRRLAGRVTEVQIAGAGFLRLDIPGEPPVTQFIRPDTVYALHPTTEEIARAFAARHRPQPVQQWELAPPVPARAEIHERADEADPWEGGPY